MIAKFPGNCTACGGRIAAGENCEWTKGQGIRHTGPCPEAQAPKQVTVTMGVFRKNGKVYVVKANREKNSVYSY
jgi:hypothetical protein